MLSILIPTYNNDCYDVVEALQRQAVKGNFPYEIIVMDNCSTMPVARNEQINALSGCRYIKLGKNIGKTKIKNRLAEEVKGDVLLLLDDDGMPESDDYLEKYYRQMDNPQVQVVCGGRTYQPTKPNREFYLHWKYGKSREVKSASERNRHPYNSFMIANMCIKKSVYEQIRLDERMHLYGHEDSVFGINLKHAMIPVCHIDNPLRHIGLVSVKKFIDNQAESVNSVAMLIRNGQEDVELIKLANVYKRMRTLRLNGILSHFADAIDKLARRQLEGNSPCLRLMDFWKLTHLCAVLKN